LRARPSETSGRRNGSLSPIKVVVTLLGTAIPRASDASRDRGTPLDMLAAVSEKWQSVRLDEIESIPVAGAGVNWRPLRRTLGVEAFGINSYVAEAAGDHVVEEHSESSLGHEEVYVVLNGHATFTLGGETLEAPAGTLVFVRDPEVKRSAVAVEARTSVLAIGGKAGEAYTASPWEWFFYAERFRPSKDWDGGVAFLKEGVARYPDHAGMLYSLACWEAMAGEHEEALAHLQRAVELEPRNATWAARDEDLDSIREEPGFPTPGG
jgi:quercetin dioxygenase-like cupin family protein